MQANRKKKSLNRNVEFGTKKIKFKDVIIVSVIMLVVLFVLLQVMN